MAGSTRSPDVTVKHKTERVRFIHGKSHIGRYDLMFPLDMGGMAAVYCGRLAGPAGFEKLVALKIIYPHLAAEEAFIHMFFDEARIVAGIRHPNVAEIYEVGEDEGVYFMAMELIEGHSMHALAHRVRETHAAVPHELYAEMVAKVCRGAHDAHQLCDPDGKPLNLVHRDISPRNVLISYRGEVKLIDFGVAWAEERLTHTMNGGAKGKVGYMPPEYIKGEGLDRRSDIFALGVVLYNMLTEAHPYPGRTEGERIDNILHGRVMKPSELRPDIHPELEELLLKALHLDPAKRFNTALEMAEALEDFCRRHGKATGQDQTAALMERLFDAESKEFHRKIRKFRKHNPKAWETPSVGTPIGLSQSQDNPDDITEQLTDSEVMFAERGTRLERVEEEPRAQGGQGRRKPWLVASVAAAALGLAMLAWQLSPQPRESSETPRPATAPPAVAEVEPPSVAPPSRPMAPPPASEVEGTVHIRFTVDSSETIAALDGVKLAPQAREVVLRRDGTTHTLEFSRSGFYPERVTFEASQDADLTVALTRMPSRRKDDKSARDQVKMLSNPFD